jgi:hypothetical protein
VDVGWSERRPSALGQRVRDQARIVHEGFASNLRLAFPNPADSFRVRQDKP